MTDSGVRSSAEALLSPNFNSNSGLLSDINAVQQLEQHLNSTHNSLSSLEGAYLEEIATDATRSGRISTVRRFFCCFVLFDLLLVSLTWLICITIMGGNSIIEILKTQILNYNITTSLFDLVMAAVCRFTILLLFYGVLKFNTTFFVASTTFTTTIFLIFKVVYYSWTTASQPAFQVIIILMSFIVAWLETWFFDFRVIPQELFASQYAQSTGRFSESLSNLLLDRNLRNPVIRNFLRNTVALGEDAESTVNFYSPLESPNGSDDEGDDQKAISKPLNSELIKRGKDTLEVAWGILNSRDWKLDRATPDGDLVYSMHQRNFGRFYLLRTNLNIKAETLLQELFRNVDRFTSWNKTMLESRRVVVIDDHTDVTYQVSSPGGNGVVSSRDFVNLRHWDMKEDCFVLAGISVFYSSLPSTKLYIRGENGPCCWVMRPIKDESDSCVFEFLLNTNLKGWVPQYVVEAALASVLLEYSDCLKEHIRTLNKLGVV